MPTLSQLESSSPPLPACKNKVFLVTNMLEEQLLTDLQSTLTRNLCSAVCITPSLQKIQTGMRRHAVCEMPFWSVKRGSSLFQAECAPFLLPLKILR